MADQQQQPQQQQQQQGQDNADAAVFLPAPAGWTKRVDQIRGRPKVVFISPGGEEISRKKHLKEYLAAHEGSPDISEFSWGLNGTGRRSARLNVQPAPPAGAIMPQGNPPAGAVVPPAGAVLPPGGTPAGAVMAQAGTTPRRSPRLNPNSQPLLSLESVMTPTKKQKRSTPKKEVKDKVADDKETGGSGQGGGAACGV